MARLVNLRKRDLLAAWVMVQVELSGILWSAHCLFRVCSPPISPVVHQDRRHWLRNRIDSTCLVKHPDNQLNIWLFNWPGYASVQNIHVHHVHVHTYIIKTCGLINTPCH